MGKRVIKTTSEILSSCLFRHTDIFQCVCDGLPNYQTSVIMSWSRTVARWLNSFFLLLFPGTKVHDVMMWKKAWNLTEQGQDGEKRERNVANLPVMYSVSSLIGFEHVFPPFPALSTTHTVSVDIKKRLACTVNTDPPFN